MIEQDCYIHDTSGKNLNNLVVIDHSPFIISNMIQQDPVESFNITRKLNQELNNYNLYKESLMITKAHWEECKELSSYSAARKLAAHLKEVAIANKFNPNSVKVLSKRQVHRNGYIADAQVIWEGGPLGWTTGIKLADVIGVCSEVEDISTISFYDIYFDKVVGG